MRNALCIALCLCFLAPVGLAESLTLCGVEVDAGATSVDLGDARMTNLNSFIAELEQLPSLRTVDMYQSSLKRAQMAELSERFPDIRFGWTLRISSKWRVRTDITAFSTLNNTHSEAYHSETFEILKYCKDLQALDLGHNEVKDLTFLENFPHLKVLILADNCVSDLTPLAGLKELEYLELFMNHVTDLSPLADHDALLDLNLCHNRIEDASPLATCENLERVWISYNKLTDESKAALQAALPATLFNFTVYSSTESGWREHARYFVLKEMFSVRAYQPFGRADA